MSKAITLGFPRAGGKPTLLYGTETSEADQRAAIRALGDESDTYEKIAMYYIPIAAKQKRMDYSNQPTLTITAANKSITYGDNPPTYTDTYSGWTDGDSVKRNDLTGTLTNTCTYAKGNGAGTYNIVPSGQSSEKYNILYQNGTLTVAKKALTITAANKTMTAGGSAPENSVSYSGFITGDDESDLTGSLAFAYQTTDGEAVADITAAEAGTYKIVPSGLSSDNYQISYVAGTLTIEAAPDPDPDPDPEG